MNAPYDVVVAGAGNAALGAALSAREQGARVLLLERAPHEQRGGNSAFVRSLLFELPRRRRSAERLDITRPSRSNLR